MVTHSMLNFMVILLFKMLCYLQKYHLVIDRFDRYRKDTECFLFSLSKLHSRIGNATIKKLYYSKGFKDQEMGKLALNSPCFRNVKSAFICTQWLYLRIIFRFVNIERSLRGYEASKRAWRSFGYQWRLMFICYPPARLESIPVVHSNVIHIKNLCKLLMFFLIRMS